MKAIGCCVRLHLSLCWSTVRQSSVLFTVVSMAGPKQPGDERAVSQSGSRVRDLLPELPVCAR